MTLVKDEVTLNFREAGGVEDVALEGTPWTVTGTLEGDATASLDTEPATIAFNDGTADVFAGCNTGSVSYTLTDTTIEFGELLLTAMACEEPATKLEATVHRGARRHPHLRHRGHQAHHRHAGRHGAHAHLRPLTRKAVRWRR